MTNCSEDNKNISFHRLPSKREEVKKKWLHNLKRKNVPEAVFILTTKIDFLFEYSDVIANEMYLLF